MKKQPNSATRLVNGSGTVAPSSGQRSLTAVDLFAGAGGFSLGLRRAGFDVVLANEYSVDPEWTYRYNLLHGTPEGEFPERPAEATTRARKAYRTTVRNQMLDERGRLATDFERRMRGGDIRQVLPDGWLRRWRAQHSAGIDIVVAGPPCQGFSCAGTLCPNDERNGLVYEAVRVIRRLQPRVAIIENVPGMLERHSGLVREIGMTLGRPSKASPGYYVFAELVHGEPLGVPQTRRRLLVIGVRRDLVEPTAFDRLFGLLFPVACPRSRPDDGRLFGKSVSVGAALTAGHILGDLSRDPPIYGNGGSWTARYRRVSSSRQYYDFLCEVRAACAVYLGGGVATATTMSSSEYYNHESSSHEAAVARRFRLLRRAAAASSESRAHRCSSAWLRQQFTGDYPGLVTRKASQRLLLPDEWPMLTVTSLPDDIVHFEEDRIPTVREVARLQTFPDWFEFNGVRTTGAERRRLGVYVPQYTQVANAVPPRLAHAVAARIRQFLLLVADDPACNFEPVGGLYTTPHLRGTARAHLDELAGFFRPACLPRRLHHGVDSRVSDSPLAVGANP